MVFKNTQANRQLAKKMEAAVKCYTGYVAIVDYNWNCGQDIRFEIGTYCGCNIPFTVQTFYTDTGCFEIKLRMQQTEFDSIDVLELKHWLDKLEPLTRRLRNYIEELKPQQSICA